MGYSLFFYSFKKMEHKTKTASTVIKMLKIAVGFTSN